MSHDKATHMRSVMNGGSSARAQRQLSLVYTALGMPGAVCLVFFFLVPLAVVTLEAFVGGGSGFLRLLAQNTFWAGLLNTLMLGILAGAIAVSVGFIVALHLSQLSERQRTSLLFFISLPLTFSGLVVAFGFIISFGRAGFFTQILASTTGIDAASIAQFVYSPYGLAFVYSYYLTPRVIMLLTPVLVNFDRNQLLAAETFGASQWRALRDILIPQVFPTALAAYCLVVAVAFGAYGTALALVGSQVNILPLQLFTMISDANTDFAQAAALALILTALCSIVMTAGETIASRHDEH